MDDNQAAKSVIKKLSALRATLLDEEQVYLDNLILGRSASETMTGNSAADNSVSGVLSKKRGDMALDEGLRAGNVTPGRITWNDNKEIYELDK